MKWKNRGGGVARTAAEKCGGRFGNVTAGPSRTRRPPRSLASDRSGSFLLGIAGAGPRWRHEPAPGAICETCFAEQTASPPANRYLHHRGREPHRHEGLWPLAGRTMWRTCAVEALCRGEVPGLPGAVARPPPRNRGTGFCDDITPAAKLVTRFMTRILNGRVTDVTHHALRQTLELLQQALHVDTQLPPRLRGALERSPPPSRSLFRYSSAFNSGV